ncbi:MAG: hypothetical protein NW223_02085 [Hyphomicrobiaceae bacterium]|nr:hypothetical protein [Hyphomicrobiaceae bacterium]
MGLLRVAFGAGLVVLLMPSDEGQQQRLYQNASYAVDRAVTFCDRNAKTCETAGNVWDVFVRKLEFAVRMGYDLATSAGKEEGQTPYVEPAVEGTQRSRVQPRPAGRGEDPYGYRRQGT